MCLLGEVVSLAIYMCRINEVSDYSDTGFELYSNLQALIPKF